MIQQFHFQIFIKENESTNSETCMHHYVHCCTIYNSQGLEAVWGNSVRLYFCGLQNHCRWWLQPWNKKTLSPWKKIMTNPDSILKSRDITLPSNVCLVKAMVFPVVMYGCEIWTIKKVEELTLLNCDVGKDSWESLGLRGDQSSQS